MALDYERDIVIDESALDVECLDQPRLMLKYGEASAKAYKAVDIAKDNLAMVKAEIDEAIRKDPDKYGLSKITDSAVESAVVRSPQYVEASHQHIIAKYQANLARTAAESINARKDSLEFLIRLHGQQYFAGPSVPRDLSIEWQRRQKQLRSDSAVSAGLQRKK